MKLRFFLLAIGCLMFSSCAETLVIKYPSVAGQVVDSRTHLPVKDAQVFYPDRRLPVTTTDVDGHFYVPAHSGPAMYAARVIYHHTQFMPVPSRLHEKRYVAPQLGFGLGQEEVPFWVVETQMDHATPFSFGIFREPISVEILLDKPKSFISVTGGVIAPCRVPWTPSLTLLGAIDAAGGMVWDSRAVVLIRGKSSTRFEFVDIRGDFLPYPKLQPGDIIKIVVR